jgi:hypothetical protein
MEWECYKSSGLPVSEGDIDIARRSDMVKRIDIASNYSLLFACEMLSSQYILQKHSCNPVVMAIHQVSILLPTAG